MKIGKLTSLYNFHFNFNSIDFDSSKSTNGHGLKKTLNLLIFLILTFLF